MLPAAHGSLLRRDDVGLLGPLLRAPSSGRSFPPAQSHSRRRSPPFFLGVRSQRLPFCLIFLRSTLVLPITNVAADDRTSLTTFSTGEPGCRAHAAGNRR